MLLRNSKIVKRKMSEDRIEGDMQPSRPLSSNSSTASMAGNALICSGDLLTSADAHQGENSQPQENNNGINSQTAMPSISLDVFQQLISQLSQKIEQQSSEITSFKREINQNFDLQSRELSSFKGEINQNFEKVNREMGEIKCGFREKVRELDEKMHKEVEQIRNEIEGREAKIVQEISIQSEKVDKALSYSDANLRKVQEEMSKTQFV